MALRTNKKKRRKWPYWVGGILFALVLIGGGFVYYAYTQIDHSFDTMHTPLSRDQDTNRQKEMNERAEEKESLNFLLLGIDEREDDSGRSDTIIFLSLNPRTDSMVMVSIPRDTYVSIPGYGMDKINHAYAFGGADLAIETVEENLDIPVHFYTTINMEGFQQGIDALGGVTVNNTESFQEGGIHFEEGSLHLNGEEALEYIRMRKQDPRGDRGRNERQREVMQAAMDEAASFNSVTKFGEILAILDENVQTDLDMEKIQKLFTGYRGARHNMEVLEMDGTGTTIEGIWYYVVSDSEFQRIHTEVINHMENR